MEGFASSDEMANTTAIATFFMRTPNLKHAVAGFNRF
jgi:hypothetical protein